jgi:hypothetical protein
MAINAENSDNVFLDFQFRQGHFLAIVFPSWMSLIYVTLAAKALYDIIYINNGFNEEEGTMIKMSYKILLVCLLLVSQLLFAPMP